MCFFINTRRNYILQKGHVTDLIGIGLCICIIYVNNISVLKQMYNTYNLPKLVARLCMYLHYINATFYTPGITN